VDKWWKVWQEWRVGEGDAEQRKKRGSYFLVLACVGIVLMVAPKWFTTAKTSSVQPTAVSEQDSSGSQSQLEQKIAGMLRQLPGVGEVDVMIVLDSSEKRIIQQNEDQKQQVTEESDKAGVSRQTHEQSKQMQTVFQQAGGNQQPFVVQTIEPKVRGVIVVAQGAEHAVVRKQITDALRRGLDVPLAGIAVLPSKFTTQ
jgi:stage III sporulation protein AG